MGRNVPGGPRRAPNRDLLRARIERGLSRERLGESAGISAKQIRLIERGDVRRPQALTKKKLAEALDTEVLTVFPLGREESLRPGDRR
jgi:transcriptional regulator with XRE-family HTH domain